MVTRLLQVFKPVKPESFLCIVVDQFFALRSFKSLSFWFFCLDAKESLYVHFNLLICKTALIHRD